MVKALRVGMDEREIEGAARRARSMLNKRALVAAAASAVPLPGLDWAVDAALLSRMVPEINKEFGLTHEQIEGLDARSREQVHKAVAVVGSALVGRLMTREALLMALKTVGVRAGAGQIARYAPVVGQALSAAAGYAAIRYFGERHIRDCERVARLALDSSVAFDAPGPKRPRKRAGPAGP